MTQLYTIIEKGGGKNKPIPPGISTEYGFGLYKIGKHQEAIHYFEKEKSLWPDSAPLMDRMISNTQNIMEEGKTP